MSIFYKARRMIQPCKLMAASTFLSHPLPIVPKLFPPISSFTPSLPFTSPPSFGSPPFTSTSRRLFSSPHHSHSDSPVPPPPALQCPRCHSSNTRFDHYNHGLIHLLRWRCRECKKRWTVGRKILVSVDVYPLPSGPILTLPSPSGPVVSPPPSYLSAPPLSEPTVPPPQSEPTISPPPSDVSAPSPSEATVSLPPPFEATASLPVSDVPAPPSAEGPNSDQKNSDQKRGNWSMYIQLINLALILLFL